MTKHTFFKTPYSKQAPTKPSLEKENFKEAKDLLHIESNPPLLPEDGWETHWQSSPPQIL
jgi:hypothetical protein